LVLSLKPNGTYQYVEQDSAHEWLLCSGELEVSRRGQSDFVLSFPDWWEELGRYQYLHFIGRDTLSMYPTIPGGSIDDAPTQVFARNSKAASGDGRQAKRKRLPAGNRPQAFFVNRDPREGDFVYYEEAPVPITKVQPVYPEFAKEARIEGKVILHVLVGRDGLVWDARVFRGVRGLDEATLDAIKKWVFKPAMSNNKPVAVWIEVPLSFPP
jgi:protein TonB